MRRLPRVVMVRAPRWHSAFTNEGRRSFATLAKAVPLVPLHRGFDSLNVNLSWPELWDRLGPFWRGPFWL
jgi:hypothetical protein